MIRKYYFNQKRNSTKASSKIETISFNEMKEDFIGKEGTAVREKYEYKLKMEVSTRMMKSQSQECNLT